MALSRTKTWVAAEILTASDLNAEFNNILDNAISLISPLTAALDADGKEIILDADGDTSITADTDDQIDVKIAGSDDFKITANLFDILSGSSLNVNAGASLKVAGVATWTKGADVTAATDTLIGIDGNMFDVAGATTIVTLATKGIGTFVFLHFDSTPTLTHDATNLILPGGANITAAAGDEALFYEYATADWRCVAYTKATGKAVIASGIANLVEDATPQLGSALDPNGQFIGRDKGGDITSASPLVIDTDGDYFDVTGTTGFSVMTVATNRSFVLQFVSTVAITVGSGITLNNAGSNYTTAAGDIIVCQSTAANTVTGWIIKADGTAIVETGITLETEKDTSSGSSFTFTGIPAGVKRIHVMFEGVSLDDADDMLIQLGDAGGIETSGYVSSSHNDGAASVDSTAGFIMSSTATSVISGHMILTLFNAATFTWISSHSCHATNILGIFGGGTKSLSAELTQLTLIDTGGDDFDAGAVNIQYEF